MTKALNTVKPTSVVLPYALKAKIEAAATEAGHSLSDEMRARLEASFVEPAEPWEVADATGALIGTIAALAKHLKKLTNNDWWLDPWAAQVMRAAVVARLEAMGAGEGKPEPPKGFEGVDPAVVGRMLMAFSEV